MVANGDGEKRVSFLEKPVQTVGKIAKESLEEIEQGYDEGMGMSGDEERDEIYDNRYNDGNSDSLSENEGDETSKKYDLKYCEDETINEYGNIKLTPFNMKDELENDGHFSKDGHFVFSKQSDEPDAWLDSFASSRVKYSTKSADKNDSEYIEIDDKDMKNSDEAKLISKLIETLIESTTVSKSIRMYGAKNSPAHDFAKMNLMTELADNLLGLGYYNVYEYDKAKLVALSSSSSNTAENEIAQGENESINPVDSLPEVEWYYKWKNEEQNEVFGPFTSKTMLGWSESGFFPDGVFVRKSTAPSNGEFSSSKRIDFSLYCD